VAVLAGAIRATSDRSSRDRGTPGAS